MKPYKSLALPRGQVNFVDNDHIVFENGRGLVVSNLQFPTSAEVIVETFRYGITAFTTNTRRKYIAFSPRTSRPPIQVLNYPGVEVVCSLTGGASLEYVGMTFSHDGKRMCAVSNENSLYVYCLESSIIVAKSELPATKMLPFESKFISTNPASSNMICLGGTCGIVFGRVHFDFNRTQIIFTRAASIASDNTKISDPGELQTAVHSSANKFVTHSWGAMGALYAANEQGVVVEFDACKNIIRRKVNVPDMCSATVCVLVSLPDSFLVAACSDGTCRWINLQKLDSLDFLANLDCGQLDAQVAKDSNRILVCCPSPSYSHLLMFTEGGALCRLCVNSVYEASAPTVAPCVAELHCDTIVSMSEVKLGTESFWASASIDGAIRLMDHQAVQCSKYIFWSESPSGDQASLYDAMPITALGSSPRHPMIGVGLSKGMFYIMHVHFIETAELCSAEMVPLVNLQLFKHPVTAIAFHPDEMLVAVACGPDRAVYILDANPDSKDILTVVAHTVLQGSFRITSLSWHYRQVLAFADNCSVATIQVPESADQMQVPLVPCSSISLEHTLLSTTLVTTAAGAFVCAVAPDRNEILLYAVTPEFPRLELHRVANPHERGLLCLTVSRDGKLLVTGDVNGTLVVWRLHNEELSLDSVASFPLLHDGPILSIVFIDSDTAVCSAGLDCSVFVSRISEQKTSLINSTTPSARPDRARNTKGGQVILNLPTHQELYLTRQIELQLHNAQAQKAIKLKLIADLRHELKELLSKNSSAPPLEKLERHEFVIDSKGRDRILDANKVRVDAVCKKLDQEDMQRDQISLRIRAHCWDSMETHATECRALLKNLIVANFPLPARIYATTKRIDLICNLRRLELRDISAGNNTGLSTWSLRSNMVPQRIDWMVNEGKLSTELDLATATFHDFSNKNAIVPGAEILEEEDEEGEQPKIKQTNVNERSLLAQLYPPTVVVSPSQKRTQILLIGIFIRQVQSSFNDQFSRIHQLKSDELEKIDDKNLRVCSILNELNLEEDFFKPNPMNINENPEAILTISQEDISVIPYSRGVGDCQLDNPQCEPGTEANGNATQTRALDDMMYGTLDTKHDIDILKTDLLPPKWFDDNIDLNQLTEDQLKELASFEAASKQLNDERDKHQKVLELELRKLKTEIHEIARNFDDKLKALVEARIKVMRYSATQESYAMQMSISLLDQECALLMSRALESKMLKLRTTLDEKDTYCCGLKQKLEETSHQVEVLRNEDRQMERNFRRDIQLEQTLDEDVTCVLLELYKYRTSHKVALDLADEHTDSYVPHPEELDILDGFKVDKSIINKVHLLRQRKIQQEHEISSLEHKLQELKSQIGEIMIKNKCTEDEFQSKLGHMRLIEDKVSTAEQNIDLMVQLKQGQDEVEQEAVVTDYSGAVLVPVDMIHEVNGEIRRLGSEQTKILVKMKHFRKSINYMDWENNYMKEQTHDLEEYYTDIQLLHVTKDLQSILKGDNGEGNKEQSTEVEMRIKTMIRTHQENCTKLKFANAKLSHHIQDRDEENGRLKLQLQDLEGNVVIRESILKSHVENQGNERSSTEEASNSMKRIVLRRRLIDLARLQTEEIDFLRQELDRLRQRTFPSFSQATRHKF